MTAEQIALLNASTQLAGTAINAYSGAQQNEKQREWSKEMYTLQRQHALEDWDRQNAYNSPEAQMRRLQAGGLNPNLVYGTGAVANNSQAIRSSQAQSYTPQPIRVDLSSIGDSINMYQEIKTRTLQNSNLQKQNELMEQNKLLAAAKTAVELEKAGYYPSLTDVAKENKWLTMAKTFGEENKLTDWKNTHLVSYDIMKQKLTNMKQDLATAIANQTKTNAQTNEINTLLPSKLQNNLQDILLKKSATTKNEAETKRIGAAIINLQQLSTQNEFKQGFKFLGLDFGAYGSSKGSFYDQFTKSKELDKIMRTIVPDWDKKNPQEKGIIYHNLNQ